MEEILKKLLDENILTEETKKELESVIKTKLDEAIVEAKKSAEADVRAQLTEQFMVERDALIEALDTKVSAWLAEEITEFKSDVEEHRDEKAAYAEKLVEAKGQMAEQLKEDLGELVEKLDKFLEVRLTAELDELREDIEEQKKKEFGKKVFEAFVNEYKSHYAGDESLEGTLRETEQRLEDALTSLEKIEDEKNKLLREKKMKEVLAPLSGRQKEVMEAILQSVDTGMLVEAYNTYLPRIMKDANVKQETKTSEKETKVLAEGAQKVVSEGIIKTGDNADKAKDEETDKKEQQLITESEKARLRKIAGLA